MKLSTSLVAVKKITTNKPRSIFADDVLEQAAKLILETEGVINPIVVRRTSIDSYEVVDGDFEYYAAARAREIDLRKGEMIGVYIIEPENEGAMMEQVKAFRRQKSPDLDRTDPGSDSMAAYLKNIETRLEKRINELLEQVIAKQSLENELKELQKQMANRVEPLEVFNTLQLSQLLFRLKSTGLTDKKAAEIAECIDAERKKKQFESLNDVVERVKIKSGKRQVKGISSEKMVMIIDSWSRLLFI